MKRKRLKPHGKQIRISEKSKFFQLIHYDNDEFYPYDIDEFSAIGDVMLVLHAILYLLMDLLQHVGDSLLLLEKCGAKNGKMFFLEMIY
ncbi:MAG: hypothetical protein ACLU00_00855 [Mediterraneibacter faecis]